MSKANMVRLLTKHSNKLSNCGSIILAASTIAPSSSRYIMAYASFLGGRSNCYSRSISRVAVVNNRNGVGISLLSQNHEHYQKAVWKSNCHYLSSSYSSSSPSSWVFQRRKYQKHTEFFASLENTNDDRNDDRNDFTKRTLKTDSHKTKKIIEGDDDSLQSQPMINPKKRNNKKSSKRNNQDSQLLRADRVLSTRTSYSRSQSFDLLKSRRVAICHEPKLQSQILTNIKGPKEKIPLNAKLYLDGKPIPPLPPLFILFHKPKYVLSAMASNDRSDKDYLGKYLSDLHQKVGMHPVGRLDYDTSGLILFSRSGELTQRLLHPRHGVEKEYVATVEGSVDEKELKERLEVRGVETGEGIHFGKLLEVEKSVEIFLKGADDDKVDVDALIDLRETKGNDNDEGVNFAKERKSVLSNVRLVVQEGKYRMVRRMLANCGHPVVELKRERHGQVCLGDLAEGLFRDATEAEVQWAESLLEKK